MYISKDNNIAVGLTSCVFFWPTDQPIFCKINLSNNISNRYGLIKNKLRTTRSSRNFANKFDIPHYDIPFKNIVQRWWKQEDIPIPLPLLDSQGHRRGEGELR